MSDLVSIITPLYNSEKFIGATIESVLAQSYSNWEMIVVDDVSSDNGVSVTEEYRKKDERIRLFQLEENSGPAIARNRAIEEAKGRYIAFLDADDLWRPQKLERQLSFMIEKDAVLSFTSYARVDEQSAELIDLIRAPSTVDYQELLKQNTIGCLTAIYDTEKIGKVYMPEILKRQDFALWLKILKSAPVAYGLDEVLAEYRVRCADSVSSNKIRASFYNWKLYREIEGLSVAKSLYYFGCYTFRSLKKYQGIGK